MTKLKNKIYSSLYKAPTEEKKKKTRIHSKKSFR